MQLRSVFFRHTSRVKILDMNYHNVLSQNSTRIIKSHSGEFFLLYGSYPMRYSRYNFDDKSNQNGQLFLQFINIISPWIKPIQTHFFFLRCSDKMIQIRSKLLFVYSCSNQHKKFHEKTFSSKVIGYLWIYHNVFRENYQR